MVWPWKQVKAIIQMSMPSRTQEIIVEQSLKD